MSRSRESGNVLFFILLGIVLLTALSYAVTQGSRDSASSMNTDQQRLAATDILGYGDLITKSVELLRLRGVTLSNLSFANTSLGTTYGTAGAAPTDEVFNSQGAAAIYQQASANVFASGPQDYVFTAANEIGQAGTTCGAASCSDLIMLLPGLKQAVCSQINALLGVGQPTDAPPVQAGVDVTPFRGTPTYTKTINLPAFYGKNAGCFFDSAHSSYDFFQVLLAQ